MKIKEFLKPDWRKELLFLLISPILSCILLSSWSLGRNCVEGDVEGIWCDYPLNFLLFGAYILANFILLGGMFLHSYLGIVSYIGVLIPLFFVYFLSCLIIFAYDKFRGRWK